MSAPPPICTGTTKAGAPCRSKAVTDAGTCRRHAPEGAELAPPPAKPTTYRRSYGRGHAYYVDGVKATGVTTAIGRGLAKPALVNWSARLTAEAAVDELDLWRPLLEQSSRDAAVDYLRGVSTRSRNKAAARGTEVHRIAELLAAGEEVEVAEHVEAHVDNYLAWRKLWRPTDIMVERMVIHRRAMYGGTFDLIADLEACPHPTEDRPLRLLIDLKTTDSGIFPEVALQLAAYRYATEVADLDGTGLEPMPAVDGAAALWITADHAELIPVAAGPAVHRAFLYVLEAARFGFDSDDNRDAYVLPAGNPGNADPFLS